MPAEAVPGRAFTAIHIALATTVSVAIAALRLTMCTLTSDVSRLILTGATLPERRGDVTRKFRHARGREPSLRAW